MLTDIARIESIIAQKRSPAHEKISAMMVDLKLPIINALQTAGKNIDKKMVQHCYTLQTTLSEAKYDESLLRKVESLISHIKRYNTTANQLSIILEGHQENIQRAAELEEEIRNNLILTLQSPKMVGQNSALCVKCGLIEEVFTAKDFKGNTIEIKYVIRPDEQDISQGKIVLIGKL